MVSTPEERQEREMVMNNLRHDLGIANRERDRLRRDNWEIRNWLRTEQKLEIGDDDLLLPFVKAEVVDAEEEMVERGEKLTRALGRAEIAESALVSAQERVAELERLHVEAVDVNRRNCVEMRTALGTPADATTGEMQTEARRLRVELQAAEELIDALPSRSDLEAVRAQRDGLARRCGEFRRLYAGMLAAHTACIEQRERVAELEREYEELIEQTIQDEKRIMRLEKLGEQMAAKVQASQWGAALSEANTEEAKALFQANLKLTSRVADLEAENDRLRTERVESATRVSRLVVRENELTAVLRQCQEDRDTARAEAGRAKNGARWLQERLESLIKEVDRLELFIVIDPSVPAEQPDPEGGIDLTDEEFSSFLASARGTESSPAVQGEPAAPVPAAPALEDAADQLYAAAHCIAVEDVEWHDPGLEKIRELLRSWRPPAPAVPAEQEVLPCGHTFEEAQWSIRHELCDPAPAVLDTAPSASAGDARDTFVSPTADERWEPKAGDRVALDCIPTQIGTVKSIDAEIHWDEDGDSDENDDWYELSRLRPAPSPVEGGEDR